MGEKRVSRKANGKSGKVNGRKGNGRENGKLTQKEAEVLARLKKSIATTPEIAAILETSEEEAVKVVDSLFRRGYDIRFDRATKQISLVVDPVTMDPLKIDLETRQRKGGVYKYTMKVGFVGSAVFGSKFSQPTLAHTLYARFEQRGVDFAVASDITAGVMQKRRKGEVFLETAHQQKEYVLKHFPRASLKTYVVAGKRDLSFKDKKNPAYNIVRDICTDREDLIYRGDLSAEFFIKNVRVVAVNPGEDFAPYAKSLPLQRVMENMFGEETGNGCSDMKVILALFGSHMFDDQPDYMIARGFLVPTLQTMTPHQRSRRRRGFAPVLGGVILQLEFDENWQLKENGITVELVNLTRYGRKNDYLEEVRVAKNLTRKQAKVVELLNERPRTEGEISRELKIHKSRVWDIVSFLKKAGYEILTPADPEQADAKQFVVKFQPQGKFRPLDLKKIFAKEIRLGFTSDKHYGNKDSQPSCVDRAYEDAEKEKIEAMCDTGDLTGGVYDHPANKFKSFIPGIGGQMLYAADRHPRPKFKQYLIAGDHDLFASGRVGIDSVRHIFAARRPDITYLGQFKGDFEINGLGVMLMHPGGGPGYALSYQAQKRIESEIQLVNSRREKMKYRVLALGNWHVANLQFSAGVAVIVVPCFQDQTIDYMMRKGLSPWIGMWTVEFTLDEEGFISGLKAKYHNYAPYTKELDLPENVREFYGKYVFPGELHITPEDQKKP